MNAIHNVVGFTNGSVYEDIQTFLNDESFSDGTRVGYTFDIELFYSFLNKKPETLTIADLQQIENKDVLRFRNFMAKDKGYSNGTINRKIASLQSLYNFFERNQYHIKHGINTKVFDVKKLKHNVKSYGYLSIEEVDTMIQLVKKQVKGLEKSLLIKLGTRTSFREDTLLNLEWSDISKNEANDCYMVNTIEKKTGKEMSQPITNQLYNELLEIKTLPYYQKYSDGKIFHLTTKTVWEMMNRLKEEMGIPESRNVVFHSFRSVAPNYILETTGDFKQAIQETGHSNFDVFYKSYVNKQRDVSQAAGIVMDEQVNENAFEELTYEEVKLLLCGLKNGVRRQLLMEATKIIQERQ